MGIHNTIFLLKWSLYFSQKVARENSIVSFSFRYVEVHSNTTLGIPVLKAVLPTPIPIPLCYDYSQLSRILFSRSKTWCHANSIFWSSRFPLAVVLMFITSIWHILFKLRLIKSLSSFFCDSGGKKSLPWVWWNLSAHIGQQCKQQISMNIFIRGQHERKKLIQSLFQTE